MSLTAPWGVKPLTNSSCLLCTVMLHFVNWWEELSDLSQPHPHLSAAAYGLIYGGEIWKTTSSDSLMGGWRKQWNYPSERSKYKTVSTTNTIIWIWYDHCLVPLHLRSVSVSSTDKCIFSPTPMRTEAHPAFTPGFLLIFNYSVTFTNVGVFAISWQDIRCASGGGEKSLLYLFN